MDRRPTIKFRPGLERLERKELPSASPLAAHVARVEARSNASGLQSAQPAAATRTPPIISPLRTAPPKRFLAYRVTNPTGPFGKIKLFPPFQQTLVQSRQPVPGKVYNVLQIAVLNGTAQTFTASNGFTVRMSNQTKAHGYPILTGSEQWKPGQFHVFYILTKKYYPLSQVRGGFQFDLGGAYSLLVPGPSAIFLRLKYNPATFASTLNWIVSRGQGAQNGNGPPFAMPDTAINRIIAANSVRIDYGGRF